MNRAPPCPLHVDRYPSDFSGLQKDLESAEDLGLLVHNALTTNIPSSTKSVPDISFYPPDAKCNQEFLSPHTAINGIGPKTFFLSL
jgi:hypothetical protein